MDILTLQIAKNLLIIIGIRKKKCMVESLANQYVWSTDCVDSNRWFLPDAKSPIGFVLDGDGWTTGSGVAALQLPIFIFMVIPGN